MGIFFPEINFILSYLLSYLNPQKLDLKQTYMATKPPSIQEQENGSPRRCLVQI